MIAIKKLLVSLITGIGLVIFTLAALRGVTPPVLAASLTVDSPVDEVTVNGDCSLREAVLVAGGSFTTTDCLGGAVGSGPDVITLDALTYTLTISGDFEDAGFTGDLDITGGEALTITGQGPDLTVIDGNDLDRVLEVQFGTLVISGVTIYNGYTDFADGGGISNNDKLHLINSRVISNFTKGSEGGGWGGGVYNSGVLTMTDSLIARNQAEWEGGGLWNDFGGRATLTRTQIVSNSTFAPSSGSGGGVRNDQSLHLVDSIIRGNTTNNKGAGISNFGVVTLTRSTLTGNIAGDASGAVENHDRLVAIDSVLSKNKANGIGGGAIFNYASVILSRTLVVSNTSNSAGGAISNFSSGLITITNSTISSNATSLGSGGGMHIASGGVVRISNSTISLNRAQSGNGGGLNSSGELYITGTEIISNSADFSGGGLYNNIGGQVAINDSTVGHNQAESGGGGISNQAQLELSYSLVNRNSSASGGGVRNSSFLGLMSITATRITSNQTTTGPGGGIANEDSGQISLYNSTVDDNLTPNGTGAGIANMFNSVMTLTNSTISGNRSQETADGGGGIYNSLSSRLTLKNTTIANNEAAQEGGGIYNTTSTVNLQSSIIAGNTGGDCAGDMALTSLGYNIDGGASCGLNQTTDISNTDPLLLPLADNGGPTVGVENAALPTHALDQASPAINNGSPELCPATDQRGVARPAGLCDIGAYEFPGPALTIRKTAPVTVAANSLITYTLTITNRGNLSATNLVITDEVPAGVSLQNQGGGSLNNGILSWSLAQIGINQTISRQFAVQAFTASVVNANYRVSADDDASATYNRAIVTVIAEPGVGSGVLAESQRLGNLSNQGVAVADLNKDGFPDLFVANGSPNELYINDGSGSFAASLQDLGDLTSQALTLADLDNDGDEDAIVGNAAGEPNQIWLNDGQGTFTTGLVADLGSSNARGLAAGDLDGDGDPDLVIATGAGEASQIWLNDSEANFTPGAAALPVANSQAVALANLDDDPGLDIVLAHGDNSASQIFFNNGSGSFNQTLSLTGTQSSQAVALGDLNNDGRPDIVISNNNSQSQQIWLNGGGGTFNDNGSFGGGSQAVALGDFDNDGNIDALVANGGDSSNQLYLGNGAGSFSLNQEVNNSNGQAIALNDIDLDGDLDAIIGNGGNQGSSVLLNQNNVQGSFTPGTPTVLTFGDGLTLTVTIPANALAQATTFSYNPRPGPTLPISPELRFAGRAFDLTTTNGLTQFNPSITLTAYFPPDEQGNQANLRLYLRDPQRGTGAAQWYDAAQTCTPASEYISTTTFLAVAICHLTEFSLFDLTSSSDVYLPLILKNQ